MFYPVTANSSASNQPILVFLSCPQVSGNRQKAENKLHGYWWLHEENHDLASF